MLRILKSLLSYFVVIPEQQFDSHYSGRMDIRWENGSLALNSPEANYSFNSLHKVFQTAFKSLDLDKLGNRRVLNLGMGAGSTVAILRNQYGLKNHIDSIEIDPEIIFNAKKYFKVDEYESHTIHCANALDFLEQQDEYYGLVLVDLFIDKKVSEQFMSEQFYSAIEEILPEDGQVVFNYIGSEPHPFLTYMPDHYHKKVVQKGENQVLIYRRTERS